MGKNKFSIKKRVPVNFFGGEFFEDFLRCKNFKDEGDAKFWLARKGFKPIKTPEHAPKGFYGDLYYRDEGGVEAVLELY